MEKEKVVLVGCGQHARVVLYNMREQGRYDVACFLDGDIKKIGTMFEGYLVAGTYDDLSTIREKFKTNKFFIAFGNMNARKTVYEKFVAEGWEAVNIFHPQAVISSDAKIGKGVLIECGCMITPNPTIGNNVVINPGSQVNHDNIVEDHVYMASGVILSGGVTVGEDTLLDDGVIISIGRTVGRRCIVGAGAVVTKDIPDGSVAYGCPAKVIRER